MILFHPPSKVFINFYQREHIFIALPTQLEWYEEDDMKKLKWYKHGTSWPFSGILASFHFKHFNLTYHII